MSDLTEWLRSICGNDKAHKAYEAANLIEQQQREIEALKKDRDGWKHDRDVCDRAFNDCSKHCDEVIEENKALAAHVESLKASSCKLCDLTEEGEFYERCEAANDLMEVVEQSPTTSLNAVIREVVIHISESFKGDWKDCGVAPELLVERYADHFYPIDGEG